MAFRSRGFPNSAVRNVLIRKILHMMPNTLDSVQPEAVLDLVVEKKELRDVPFVLIYFEISDLRFRNEYVQACQQIDGGLHGATRILLISSSRTSLICSEIKLHREQKVAWIGCIYGKPGDKFYSQC